MKFFRNLNLKNKKNIQPGKFIGNQINLIKMSNGNLMVINEECNCQNVNEVN